MTGRNVSVKGGRPFRTDIIVVSLSVLIILAIFVEEDLMRPSPDWWLLANPIVEPGGGGPGGGGGGTPTLVTETVVSASGHTAEGSTSDTPFEAPWAVVRWVNLTLSWTDDVGSNDELGLALQHEGQEIDSITGTTGELRLTIKDPPGGNFTVQVSAIDCPGRITSHPFDQDNGNDWDLEVVVTYEAED